MHLYSVSFDMLPIPAYLYPALAESLLFQLTGKSSATTLWITGDDLDFMKAVRNLNMPSFIYMQAGNCL